jgi:hypothetical protein
MAAKKSSRVSVAYLQIDTAFPLDFFEHYNFNINTQVDGTGGEE